MFQQGQAVKERTEERRSRTTSKSSFGVFEKSDLTTGTGPPRDTTGPPRAIYGKWVLKKDLKWA